MASDSSYNKAAADYAVAFTEALSHTKGRWAGKPFDLIDWQEQIIRDVFGILKPNGYRQFNTAYVEIPKKMGKQLALDTPIPTPTGWKQMGELTVGDQVFDETGHPCRVLALSDIDDTEQAYRLVFRDGSSIVAGERHLWSGDYTWGKTRKVLRTTGELYRMPHREHDVIAFRIPIAAALKTADVALPLDPYLYGYWLGNGCATKPEITIRTCDLESVIRNIPYPISSSWKNTGDSVVLRICALKAVLVPSFRDKVIAPVYLRASEAQRLRLLQGLMDSDGCIATRKGQAVYCSTVLALAESVRELLWSLGIKNNLVASPSKRYNQPTGETFYTIRYTAFRDSQ